MKKKSIVSFITCVCMLFSIQPISVVNANTEDIIIVPKENNVEMDEDIVDSNENSYSSCENDSTNSNNISNDAAETQEKWVYEPVMETDPETFVSLLSEADTTDDKIKVTVNGIDIKTNEEKPVNRAEVKLYIGTNYKRSEYTGENGIAELDLSDLTIEQKLNASISASKLVFQNDGIKGTNTGEAKEALYKEFPHDEYGYIRYSVELHSETIDENGNWNGEAVPITLENNKVDIAFAIDATGSMSDEINSVKNNITFLAETLKSNDLDARFSIIEYRDITLKGEDTILHTLNGSNWYSKSLDVMSVLENIKASGGGDTPETVIDALGMAASENMHWRSGASKFVFLLTDANFKNDNKYGFSSMDSLITELKRQKITTSVITTSNYKSTYQPLYESTGGIFANISSPTFSVEMKKLAESVVTAAAGDMTLTIKEPRAIYNLSTCYLANDELSRSRDYCNLIKRSLDEFAHDIAQATDGHVLIGKMILFSTDNRTNFYDLNNKAAMADIQIQTVKDERTAVHSNSLVNGFFYSDTISSTDRINKFSHLRNEKAYKNLQIFRSIHMGAKATEQYDCYFDDDYQLYSASMTHEAGHYMLGFKDEYLNKDDKEFNFSKPYRNFGLMDHYWADIEISKKDIDYAYFGGTIPDDDDKRHTAHSYEYKKSCEEVLASLLEDCSYVYKASYTYNTNPADRRASYSYAGLSESDYISVKGTGVNLLSIGNNKDATYFENMKQSQDSFGNLSFAGMSGKVVCSFVPTVPANYSLYLRKSGQSQFTEVSMDFSNGKYIADLPVDCNELAEFYLVKTASGINTCKYYTIDHSVNTNVGYIFNTVDDTVFGYTSNSAQTAYTIVSDGTNYSNGVYNSVNNAVIINDDIAGSMTDGELYSVASKDASIDFSSVSWFCYKDGIWSQLETDLSNEENNNIGARADMIGPGLYVLMARKPATEKAKAVTGLTYSQTSYSDSLVTLHFTDPNANSRHYNIYYSDSDFVDINENLVKKTYAYEGTDIDVDLLTCDRTVYLGVEVVLEDGSKSDLSKIKITTTAADSDEDGIPDWYADKYRLWPDDGNTKDIANSDDDGDGLSNLEEYKQGSDPTNPNDPVHTTITPVRGISMSQTSVVLNTDESKTLTVKINPSNASNVGVTWYIDDASIAKITPNNGSCTVTGLSEGKTDLRAVTKDGGFVATCTIEVIHTHLWDSGVITSKPTTTSTGEKLYTCTTCGEIKKEIINKIPIPSNTINSTNEINRAYSAKVQQFSLGASCVAGTGLNYVSNNPKIAVDSAGIVTVAAKYMGNAVITITTSPADGYSETVTNVTVSVGPTKTSLSSVKNLKGKKMQIKWKKNKIASGYQIQVAEDSNFTIGVKSYTISKNKTTSKKITKLVKGKVYYVRIRAYKKTSTGKAYTVWSNVKKVSIKK